jgi:hypothetical protein
MRRALPVAVERPSFVFAGKLASVDQNDGWQMKIWRVRFSAEQLRSIHHDHLGFILASSHCCNELNSVSPYIIFEQNLEELNQAERSFIQIRLFTVIRFQIAKIFEYRDLCNTYISNIRKTYPATAKKLESKSKIISRRIAAAHWAKTVRNKVAFHYDASYALDCLKAAPADQELYFFAGQIRGLTAFDFADRILVNSMFADAGGGDTSKGRDVVMQWSIELQSLITKFHAETVGEIFKFAGLWKNQEEMEIRDKYCAVPGTTCIPLSTLGNSNIT